MALNPTTFRTRALTSLVFVAVMLAGLLWNAWSFFILFSVIHFGCWYELQKLIAAIHPDYGKKSRFHYYGVMIAGWCLMMVCSNHYLVAGGIDLTRVGLYGCLLFLFVLPGVEILVTSNPDLRNLGYSILGLLYVSVGLALLLNLRCFYPDPKLDFANKRLVLVVIASLWINDTMAYLVGSLIGRTPFSPISPKKTWEGTAGGALFAVITVGIAGYLLNEGPDAGVVWQWVIIAAIVCVAGTVGDLWESKLKRMAGVKDSGRIMPGHGGFLDRFDSLLFAAPFVWLYITMFAQ